MTDLFAAHSQMAMSLGFHILFAAVGIGMMLLHHQLVHGLHRLERGIGAKAQDNQRLLLGVEDLARLGIERARRASGAVRQQAVRMGDQTVGYIKDEPVKSMLIAAAAGAATALVVGWLSRSRSDRE